MKNKLEFPKRHFTTQMNEKKTHTIFFLLKDEIDWSVGTFSFSEMKCQVDVCCSFFTGESNITLHDGSQSVVMSV